MTTSTTLPARTASARRAGQMGRLGLGLIALALVVNAGLTIRVALWSTLTGLGLGLLLVGVVLAVSRRQRATVRTFEPQESEAPLRSFIEYAPASIAMFDRDMRCLAASRRWRSDYGLGDRALEAVSHYEVFPEFGAAWKQIHQRALAGQGSRADDDRLVRADGSVQRLRWEVSPWNDAAGAIGGIVIFREDITELMRAEEESRAMAQWLRVAQAAAGAGTWQWNLLNNENVWSDEVWQLYGLEKGSCSPSYEAWCQLVFPEDREAFEHKLRDAASSGSDLSVEFRVKWPDGTTHHLLSRGAAVRDAQAKPQKYLGIVLDITAGKRAEELAREAERERASSELSLLSSAIEGLQDPLALFDAGGQLLLCNGAYARLIGEAASSLEGRRRDEILQAWSERALAVNATREAFAGDARTSSVDVCTRAGRSLRILDRRAPDGGSVQTIWDLTEDEQRAAELQRAYLAAEAGSAAKSEFLSSMSHELRTPLNAVLGFAQLLQRDTRTPLAARHRERVARIIDSGQHLLLLIEDVLDLARLESSQVAVASESIDVADVIRQVKTTLTPMAVAQDVAIEIRRSVCSLPNALGDRTRLIQALSNLGSNGIKYNHPGGRVELDAVVSRKGWLRIVVRDTGMGIPVSKQALLFQPFQRVGQEAGPIPGTGIGLVITQRLAGLMGGHVGFQSVPGTGSEFWIELRESQSPSSTLSPPS